MNNLIRVDTPAQVAAIAAANHAPYTHTSHAAAVTLADVTYFWAAA
jgi:hypothetical protein